MTQKSKVGGEYVAVPHIAEGNRPRVSFGDIEKLVAGLKGTVVSIGEMSYEKQILLQILNTGILGQEQACEEIATRIDTGLNRLMYKKGPLGVAFLSGPTGVGKTESVRVLAKELLGDENAYTRINCELFQDSHTVGNLFGSPKSYVGYGSPTPLAGAGIFSHFDGAKKSKKLHPIIQAKRDFGILLFDEIEKAHPDIRQALLGLLDDGRVTFPNGSTTNFENVFIFMTSNIGEKELSRLRSRGTMGFFSHDPDQGQEDVFQRELKDSFSPEFLGRVGEPVSFSQIKKEHCKSIIERAIEQNNEELAEYFYTWNIHIGVSSQAVDWIVEKGFNPSQGARQLMRVIDTFILGPAHRTLREYSHEAFLSRNNPTIVYYDVDTQGGLSSHFYTPDIASEQSPKEAIVQSHILPVINRVDELLSLSGQIKTMALALQRDGFSQQEISILMNMNREHTIETLLEAEDSYDGINIYTDAHIFGKNYPPRFINRLIQSKTKTIIQQQRLSLPIFLLTVIAKSIITLENLLDVSRLTSEQKTIVTRFAAASVYKLWR